MALIIISKLQCLLLDEKIIDDCILKWYWQVEYQKINEYSNGIKVWLQSNNKPFNNGISENKQILKRHLSMISEQQ